MKSKIRRIMKASTLLTVVAAIVLTTTLSSCDALGLLGGGQSEQAGRATRAAVVEDLSGTVGALSNNVEMAAFQGMALVREDRLATGTESWVSLEMTPERFALMGESSRVMVTRLIDGTAENTVFYMDRGSLWVGVKDRLRPGENIIVQTPSASLSVRGTAFSVTAGDGVTEVNVFSGEVEVRAQNVYGEPIFDENGVQLDISLVAGQSLSIAVTGGVVISVDISVQTSVNASQGVLNKLYALMPGTFPDSSGTGPPGTIVEIDLENQGVTDARLREMIVSGEIPQDVTHLILFTNQIRDVSIFSELPNLKLLDLNNNQISDISALGGLVNLEKLGLSGNQISDISALGGLTNLEWLELSYTDISDISAIGRLTKLDWLDLSYTDISDISALGGLTNLESLDLSYTEISDISAIGRLTKLNWLDLSYTEIYDISSIGRLANLEWLGLYYTEISDISALGGLTNLKGLDLSYTEIYDISALGGLTSLEWLDLSYTEISESQKNWLRARLPNCEIY